MLSGLQPGVSDVSGREAEHLCCALHIGSRLYLALLAVPPDLLFEESDARAQCRVTKASMPLDQRGTLGLPLRFLRVLQPLRELDLDARLRCDSRGLLLLRCAQRHWTELVDPIGVALLRVLGLRVGRGRGRRRTGILVRVREQYSRLRLPRLPRISFLWQGPRAGVRRVLVSLSAAGDRVRREDKRVIECEERLGPERAQLVLQRRLLADVKRCLECVLLEVRLAQAL